ncbi:MAG: outer membrane beta-barrel protein [Bacteroidales bacterium]|nr:outer membrane beta-barrel protein [Bacteroidales bacterium]
MKKSLFFLLLIAGMISTANGQFTKIGGGLAYGSGYYFNNVDFSGYRSPHLAVSFTGIYEITVPIHVAPSFTVFFPHVSTINDSKTIISEVMFDINGHYVFNSLDRFEFYGLAGLNILLTSEKNKFTGEDTYKEADNALGFNLGAGTYIKITDQFDAYCEAKYVISKYDQFMFNAGILINLDWLIKHEKKIID